MNFTAWNSPGWPMLIQLMIYKQKPEELAEEIINQLDLNWWTEIGNHPFYLSGRKDERRNIELPPAPKYEMRITLPYKSRPDRKAGVSASSFNSHGEHYVEAFNIQTTDGTKIWNGMHRNRHYANHVSIFSAERV